MADDLDALGIAVADACNDAICDAHSRAHGLPCADCEPDRCVLCVADHAAHADD